MTGFATDDELLARLGLAARTSAEDTRRTNRTLLLRALHHGGPASRADLAKLVGLTPATVSAVIRDLLEAELVEELGRTSGNVGKPATVVGIRPDGRHIVTVALPEPDRFVGALVDLSGKVVTLRSYERDGRTGDDAVDLVAGICAELCADSGRPVLGVGIASPGIVDADGVVQLAARLGWHRLPLAADLAARLDDVAVHVANDANCAALAELTFGAAPTNFVLVRVGQGVGAGLVLDGALFRGARSAAGEIGHVVVDREGVECTCGKRGCLETVISAPLLDRRLDGGDEVEVLRHAGERLGVALATVLSALDLAEVVLSGPAPVASDTFRRAVVDAVAARAMAEISAELSVRPSAFGDDDVVLGAAALVLDQELGIR